MSFGIRQIEKKPVVTFKRGDPFDVTFVFSAPADGDAGADPVYKISNIANIAYHSLTHRTSITVEAVPSSDINEGRQ